MNETTAGTIKALHMGEQIPGGSNCECCGKSLVVEGKALLIFTPVIIGDKEYKVCRDCEKVITWFCKHVGRRKDKP